MSNVIAFPLASPRLAHAWWPKVGHPAEYCGVRVKVLGVSGLNARVEYADGEGVWPQWAPTQMLKPWRDGRLPDRPAEAAMSARMAAAYAGEDRPSNSEPPEPPRAA